jgi:uncharacterized protein with NAD-binding domain and iron-sulfur cluster
MQDARGSAIIRPMRVNRERYQPKGAMGFAPPQQLTQPSALMQHGRHDWTASRRTCRRRSKFLMYHGGISMSKKKRVVILGGGVGSMSAAYAITSLPDWRERFESVDVYQLGWRLGGKGASGRDQANHDRVLEHGVHMWMGFYENAFAMMRQVYAELDRPVGAPLRTVEEAFTPQNQVGVSAPLVADDETWTRWWIDMPVGSGTPGVGGSVISFPLGMVRRLLEILRDCALHLIDPDKHPLPLQVEVVPDRRGSAQWPELPAVAALYVGVEAALEKFRDLQIDGDVGPITSLIDSLRTGAEAALPVFLHGHPTLLLLWQVFDIALAMVRGIVADGVLSLGFDAVDGEDWLEWLQRHGLTDLSVNAPLIRAGYDLVFAYPNGRDRPPLFAAGAMTRSLLRIALCYKGSIMYHLAAGMGDVVFAPFYQVLQKRGVKFHFFHRVTAMEASADGTTVTRIILNQQVKLKSADPTAYAPLYDVKGLPCWPSQPFWEQIAGGEALRLAGVDLESAWDHTSAATLELKRGQDFDQIVLGIPAGALKYCAQGIAKKNPAFKTMLAQARTAEVLAGQAWFKPTAAQMGGHAAGMVLTGEARPTDTYADMSPVLARESWGQTPEDPQSLAYFCGGMSGPEEPPLDNPHYPAERLAEGRRQMAALFRHRSGRLWPKTTSPRYPNGTDPSFFVAPPGTPDEQRWAAQYTRVNIDPHERFTLTMPGTTQGRMWPHDNGFTNLALAGDWTRNPINAACVEGSAMSGLLAARKVTGYDFPVAGASDFPELHTPGVPAVTGSLPAMVEQIGVTSGPGPLQLSNVRALMAMFPADTAALSEWVNANFTVPSGGQFEFRPLVSSVILQWAVIDKIVSTYPVLGAQLGHFKETDCGLWVPVARGVPNGADFLVDRIYLAPAVLFVDHPTAHTSGRESWCYPKQDGAFVNPQSATDPGPFTANAFVVKKPNGLSAQQRLFNVQATTANPAGQPFQSAAAAVLALFEMLVGDAQQHILPGLRLVEELPELLQEIVPVLFLKQLRDSVQPDRACFQEVQESPMQTKFRAGWPQSPYTMEILPYFSHPIAAKLGLQQKNTSIAAAWLEFDATIANSVPLS